jgi:hypothetical protein
MGDEGQESAMDRARDIDVVVDYLQDLLNVGIQVPEEVIRCANNIMNNCSDMTRLAFLMSKRGMSREEAEEVAAMYSDNDIGRGAAKRCRVYLGLE